MLNKIGKEEDYSVIVVSGEKENLNTKFLKRGEHLPVKTSGMFHYCKFTSK